MNAVARAVNVVEFNPHVPQPYALTEVAICLRDAIRAAGCASEHLSNRVDPEAYSIVLGAAPGVERECPQLDPRRCAVFNFEQFGSTSRIAGPAYRDWLRDWLVLDYHSENVAWLKRENGPAQQAIELPIVPSPALAWGEPVDKKIVDVLFFGSLSERRDRVLRELEQRGLTVERVSGAYAWELAPALRRARLVLNIHFYERALFPVARVLQPVVQGVPVVCESSVFSRLGDWSDSGIVFADYADLPNVCDALLRSPDALAGRAGRAGAFAQRIDFATPFAQALRALQAREQLPASVRRRDEADDDRLLSNEEIERILAEQAADLPEAGATPPELSMVRREPGEGRFGKWLVWIFIAFMLMGVIQSLRQ